jgi:hypothetical protein
MVFAELFVFCGAFRLARTGFGLSGGPEMFCWARAAWFFCFASGLRSCFCELRFWGLLFGLRSFPLGRLGQHHSSAVPVAVKKKGRHFTGQKKG